MSIINYNNYPGSVIQQLYKDKVPLRCGNGCIIHYEGSAGPAFPPIHVFAPKYYNVKKVEIKNITGVGYQMPQGADNS